MADWIVVIWSIFKRYKKEAMAPKGARLLFRAANKKRKPPYINVVQAKAKGAWQVNDKYKKITFSLSQRNDRY